MITGIVVKNMNGYFYVQDDTGTIHECKVRGRLKKGRYSLLVGDRVTISEDGFVESIHGRHNSMVRPAVANIDQVVLVVAAHEPDINELLLNKMLVMIEHADIPIVLCINKCDLMDSETETMVDLYKSIGYKVLMTSTYNMTGIDDLRHVLQHKVTAFAGPSGVGKSSLLNEIDPNFKLQTGEVSDKIKRGKHTTRHAELLKLECGGIVADTPGFSSLTLDDIAENELKEYFIEFDEVDTCKFGNKCIHENEPGCGVKEAVEAGEISKIRYDSYIQLLNEIRQGKRRY